MEEFNTVGDLVPYHEYRRKIKHTYVCKKCAHGFDRAQPVAECIFCNSNDIMELERDDIITGKPVYMYTCTVCHKRFVAEHAEKCIDCGAKNLHFYKTTKISTTELISTRTTQLKNRLKKRLFGKVIRRLDE
ncbi:MAG TPA: hypothetical protein VJI12_04060 [archaeon]|nr:hypothetical protein [archaeon]